MHTLMVADDHPLFREAIGTVIAAGLPDSELIEAASLAQAMERLDGCEALDLLLLDLGLPDAEGLDGLKALRQAAPWLPVAIVSADQARRTILEAIDLGAVGYIPKSTPRPELLGALTRILEGQVYLPPDIMRRPPTEPVVSPVPPPDACPGLDALTDKQLEVLVRLSRGASNKVIARELDIAETTVKTHVSAILRKLGVASRVQAILVADQADVTGRLAQRRLDA